MKMDDLLTIIQKQGLKIFGGVAVLIIGVILVRWIVKMIGRSRILVQIEPTLKNFLFNVIRVLLYAIVVLTGISVMGIPLTTFVTLFASAGVAISLAMQGALSNFVGGVIILILKPFRVGDFVKIGDTEGTIREIGTFFTELTTYDNKHISLPNSNLTNTAIINYTREPSRWAETEYSVSYSADLDRVREVLLAVAKKSGMALDQPAEPVVVVSGLGDSAVKVKLRTWCENQNYWPLMFYQAEEGKKALDAAGIAIPFPQMDVHVNYPEGELGPWKKEHISQ